MEQNTNRLNYANEPTLTLERPNTGYGFVTGREITVPERVAPSYAPDVAFKSRFLLAELLGLFFVAFSTLYIFGLPSVLTKPGQMKLMVQRAVKRSVDLVGSLVGLTLCLPFFIIVPILIKLDSRGPVFYTQLRIGVNRRRADRRYHQRNGCENRRGEDRRKEDLMGKPFRVIKFRTMVQDAEKKSGPVWASKGDPRITKLGRFLRKTRIDEIPQFLNVFMGDMALVGPRPERPNFVRDLSTQVEGYTRRLQVKPGITGLAQVEAGYDSDLESVRQKVGYDINYISNMSLWSDIKIMAKTVIVVFTGKGAC
ncbi:sugar transferase [candidate division GN15 bacterium]|nr:sugar transferase [candidate division GN15 bacterium]